MKFNADFLKDIKKLSSKALPRIDYHIDGISFNKKYSLRLSNIPKNLVFITQNILSLSKKTSAMGIASFACLMNIARAANSDCDVNGINLSNFYLTHTQNKGAIWIQSGSGVLSSGDLNNQCGFFLDNKQTGSYQKIDCFCSQQFEGGEVVYYAVLYGLNLTDKGSINCIENVISGSCFKINPNALMILLYVASSLVGAGVCCLAGYQLLRYRSRRRELSNLSIIQDPLINNNDNTEETPLRPK